MGRVTGIRNHDCIDLWEEVFVGYTRHRSGNLKQSFRLLYRFARIFGEPIGPDSPSPTLCHGGPTHHGLEPILEAGRLKFFLEMLLCPHGSGEESACSDDVGVELVGLLDEPAYGYVTPQIQEK